MSTSGKTSFTSSFALLLALTACGQARDQTATQERSSGETPTDSVSTLSQAITTLAFLPTDDAPALENEPNTTHASSIFLRADTSEPPNSALQTHSYFKFDVRGLPPRAVVTRAELRCWASSTTTNGPQAYRVGDDHGNQFGVLWTEQDLTWTNRPKRLRAYENKGAMSVDSTYYSWDVTGAVLGNGIVSFGLIPDSNDGANCRSKEDTTVAHRPSLVVSYELLPCVPPSGAYPPNRDVRAPRPVARPAPGGFYVDEYTGNPVYRITGTGTGAHGYSFWGAASLDHSDGAATVKSLIVNPDPDHGADALRYTIDTQARVVQSKGRLFASVPPGQSQNCEWQDAVFSHSDPDIVYCHTSEPPQVLYAYRVSTGEFRALHDFSGVVGTENTLQQMSVDASDDVFSFHVAHGKPTSLAMRWVRSKNSLWTRDYSGSNPPLNETQLEKTGRYLVAVLADGGGMRWDVWDFANEATPARTPVTNVGGHWAPGSGIYVGEDTTGTGPGLALRDFGSIASASNLIGFVKANGDPNWSYSSHTTFNHFDERWMVVGTFGNPKCMPKPYGDGCTGTSCPDQCPAPSVWDPWEQELLAVKSDGAQTFVVRLGHHRSYQSSYWDQPRSSLSYDGKLLMFTSNFDALGRDVYVLEMPTICQ